MSYTKKQIVVDALSDISIASYEFDLQAEEIQRGVRALDRMMAAWDKIGYKLSYPLHVSPEDIDPDAESNLPDWAVQGVVASLALKLAKTYGKMVSPDLRAELTEGMKAIRKHSAKPEPMEFPGTMPRGAGQKPWRYKNDAFMPEPKEGVTTNEEKIEGV